MQEIAKTRWQGLLLTEIRRAAIQGQLGTLPEAKATLDALLKTDAEFAVNARAELRKFYLEDNLVDHYLDGLRKAGLELPDS